MTTIAITATDVAADGMRTWGGEVRGLAFEKLRVVEAKIYAFTGWAPMLDVMVKWHCNGADPEKLPVKHDANEDGWSLILIDEHGIGKYSSTCPYRENFDPPIAFGAGGDIALGAMLAGKTARQAVAIVAGQCNHTGGRIQTIEIASVVGSVRLGETAE